MIVLLVGAPALAALMRAESDQDAAEGGWLEAMAYADCPFAAPPCKKAASRSESADRSRVSHSQTTSTTQPAAAKAAQEAPSRAALRAILAAQ